MRRPGKGRRRARGLGEAIRAHNRVMVAFDLALGSGALAAPERTLRLLGHAQPSEDAVALFRRCGPIWLTFAAAHALAATRDRPQDWWALAWLRGTEIATDVVWSTGPGFRDAPLARAVLAGAGAANLAMALAFAHLSRR